MRHRLKTQLTTFDWALALQILHKRGMTYADIEHLTGVSRTALNQYATNYQDAPKAWNQAAAIIELLMLTEG